MPLAPRHSVGLVGAWEEEGRARIGLGMCRTGRQALDDDPCRNVSRRHVVMGLLVDRRPGRFPVVLNAENIPDTRPTRFDPLLPQRRTPDGRWITDVWAPIEGRAFNAGVRVNFRRPRPRARRGRLCRGGDRARGSTVGA